MESLKTSEDGIHYCLSAGEGFSLTGLLAVKAECLVNIRESKKDCKKILLQAFLLAKLLKKKDIHEWVKIQYYEIFEQDIENEYYFISC